MSMPARTMAHVHIGQTVLGRWKVTNTRLNSFYYRKHLKVLKATPGWTTGSPMGPQLPKTYMEATYGMTWIEMRKTVRAMFKDTGRDGSIKEAVKRKSHQYIPIRTGHLMDYIFKTMNIARYSYYNTHYWSIYMFEWPKDRPSFIRNPSHAPPDEGYGEWGTVALSETIPIGRVIVIYVTAGGNALYLLNDPNAMNDPTPLINMLAQLELMRDYELVFDNLVLTCLL